ncbi:Iron-sulfur cluster assembly enzyme ISCU, mitochondrial [Triticum urartu]|uniref:Iron-sulfur cluster assembly enzyme ISCU, mitochondrial n=1 Tax=Triticum urartu TaxID=4572 RepID=M7YPJ4_TRIUA|nr:Iron-sulfur cluster assembly enzyme ISCU, mitochondrial [Triticum urartu]
MGLCPFEFVDAPAVRHGRIRLKNAGEERQGDNSRLQNTGDGRHGDNSSDPLAKTGIYAVIPHLFGYLIPSGDACFKTFACGSAIASSSVATEWVKGKQMEEVVAIKNTEIAKHLSLPPVKLHCSMLAEDAIKAAVKDYEAKKTKAAEADE